jgi:hypothetical protein
VDAAFEAKLRQVAKQLHLIDFDKAQISVVTD